MQPLQEMLKRLVPPLLGDEPRQQNAWGNFSRALETATRFPLVHRTCKSGADVPWRELLDTRTFTAREPCSDGGADEYVFLANRDYGSAVETDVYVPKTARGPELLDVANGTFGPLVVLADDPNGSKVHVKLAAADGALIHLHGGRLLRLGNASAKP